MLSANNRPGKRIFDLALALLGLVLLAPVFLILVILIRIYHGSPVIFAQKRPGFKGTPFYIYKFRTMTVLEDGPTILQASRDDKRITPIGRWLRRTSLDEIPQLFNVLEGSMSLVGPRPHAVAHNETYRKLISGYMTRHMLKPGMTGLAQIRGYRGETKTLKDMEARVEADLEYLHNWSLTLDLKILFLTLFRWRSANAY
jgi:putative colanic acid biosynthesis UDP-glucose lipid carrier transferase